MGCLTTTPPYVYTAFLHINWPTTTHRHCDQKNFTSITFYPESCQSLIAMWCMNTNLDVAPNVVPNDGRVNILLNNHCCSTLIISCFVKLNWQFTSDIVMWMWVLVFRFNMFQLKFISRISSWFRPKGSWNIRMDKCWTMSIMSDRFFGIFYNIARFLGAKWTFSKYTCVGKMNLAMTRQQFIRKRNQIILFWIHIILSCNIHLRFMENQSFTLSRYVFCAFLC